MKNNDQDYGTVIELRRGNRINFLKFCSLIVLVMALTSMVITLTLNVSDVVKSVID